VRLAAAAVALLTMAATAAGCGGAEPGPRPQTKLPLGAKHDLVYGFNDNSVARGLLTPESESALAARAGAEVVRLTLDWRAVEPSADAYDFSTADATYRALRRRGIRPLWVVAFAPDWARDQDPPCPADCRAPPARSHEREWDELLALTAKRYPRSAGIELWNEPNYANFFFPEVDVKRYARLQRRGYKAVKRARPRMPVFNGGLANFLEAAPGQVPIGRFLSDLYEHGGKQTMDALSIHIYPGDPRRSAVRTSLGTVIAARDAAGDSRRPMWVTETGASTRNERSDLRWSESGQAAELGRIRDLLSRVRGVKAMLVHTLVDEPGAPNRTEAGFGVARAGGAAKPAFCRLARFEGKRGCGR